jgi:DNA modification methylase
MKEESIARTYRKQCGAPKNGSGMIGMNTTNIRNLEFARPSNVVNVNNVSNQFTLKSDHSATFPEKLVEFFVKSFSNEGDLIVDCFAGSGTTGLVCIDTNRNYLLIDKEQSNIDLIFKRVEEKRKEKDLTQKTLFGDGM